MHEAEEDRAGSAEKSLCVSAARLGASNVAAIVKAGAARLGLEAVAFAGHSLRAGFVTSAVSARVGLEISRLRWPVAPS
jgi:hypothetical protein